MLRINSVLKQVESHLTKNSNIDLAEIKKSHQLFTMIAHGFDPNRPPSNVVLYRLASSLYNRGEYISSEQVLKEALEKAHEENCTDTVIELYKDQLTKVRGVISNLEANSAPKAERTSVLITVLKSVVASAPVFLSTGFYIGTKRPNIMFPITPY